MKQQTQVLLLAVALATAGCGEKKEGPDLEAQVREEKQRREVAEGRSRTMGGIAIAAGVGALVLFVTGAAIGGSARRHAPED